MKAGRWIVGSLILISCDLYSSFRKDNDQNCILNPPLCSAEEVCSELTAQCEPRQTGGPEDMAPPVDLAPPPPPPTGFMFQVQTPLSVTPTQISGLAAGDLNNDTYPEIVYTDGMANTLVVVPNNAGASFGSGVIKNVGTNPAAPRIFDFTKDGIVDVAHVNTGNNTVVVHSGDGTGALPTSNQVSIGTPPVDLAYGDVLGDGKVALLTANANAGTFSIIRNTTSLSLQGSYLAGSSPSTIAVGQFNMTNGQGPDVVVANRGAQQATVFNNGPILVFSPLDQYSVNYTGTPFATIAADWNGDNLTDIATVVPSLSQVIVCLVNGSGGCKATIALPTQANPAYAVAADFTGDGRVDIAVANRISRTVSIYVNTVGTFSMPLHVSTGSVVPTFIAAADFNQDAKYDIVVAEAGPAITVLRNTSN